MDPTQLLISAITALAGVVAFLWKTTHAKATKTESKLEARWEECEEKHATTKEELTNVKVQVATIEGRMDGYNKAKEDLGDMIMEAKTTMSVGLPNTAHNDNQLHSGTPFPDH